MINLKEVICMRMFKLINSFRVASADNIENQLFFEIIRY